MTTFYRVFDKILTTLVYRFCKVTELRKARLKHCEARNKYSYRIVSYAAALTSFRAAKALMMHLRVTG
jgi:hypothetical protein